MATKTFAEKLAQYQECLSRLEAATTMTVKYGSKRIYTIQLSPEAAAAHKNEEKKRLENLIKIVKREMEKNGK